MAEVVAATVEVEATAVTTVAGVTGVMATVAAIMEATVTEVMDPAMAAEVGITVVATAVTGADTS